VGKGSGVYKGSGMGNRSGVDKRSGMGKVSRVDKRSGVGNRSGVDKGCRVDKRRGMENWLRVRNGMDKRRRNSDNWGKGGGFISNVSGFGLTLLPFSRFFSSIGISSCFSGSGSFCYKSKMFSTSSSNFLSFFYGNGSD